MATYRKRESGLWEYRISYKDASGKYKRKEKGGFKTKKEAQLAAADLEKQLASGQITATNLSFADYFMEWATTFKKQSIHGSTWSKYEYTHKKLEAYFKNKKLTSITSTAYQKFINGLAEKYSQQTIRMIHIHVKQCIKQAFHDRAIMLDFTAMTVVKSQKEKADETNFYLEEDEFLSLIERSSENPEHQSHFFIYLVCKTGLRFSEAQGLTLDDIDRDSLIISVSKSYKLTGAVRGWDKTKNDQSVRQVPVDQSFIKAYDEYLKSGYKDNQDKRLFTSVSNTAANKTLKKMVARDVHIHALRHSYASFLIANGIDLLTVSKVLGHKDLTTTMTIYAHLLDKSKMENFEKIRGKFGAEEQKNR